MTNIAFAIPVEALQWGFIGMGVLLALLALQAFSQAMKGNLTKGRIFMFCIFLTFSLAMSLLGFFAEYIKSEHMLTTAVTNNSLTHVRRDIADALDEKEGFIKALEQSTPQNVAALEKARFAAKTLKRADEALAELKIPKPTQ